MGVSPLVDGFFLWEADGITQRELNERAGVMEPTTFSALKAMEKRGFVTLRQLPPRDEIEAADKPRVPSTREPGRLASETSRPDERVRRAAP
jgi:hypothetical protein